MTIVLFLDNDWQPLRVEPWTRAITDLFLGKIEVIEYSRDRAIKGIGRDYPMPAVVRLLRRFRRDRQAIKFSRLNIYTRDRFTCQYCGVQSLAEDLTFDHVVPRSAGGHGLGQHRDGVRAVQQHQGQPDAAASVDDAAAQAGEAALPADGDGQDGRPARSAGVASVLERHAGSVIWRCGRRTAARSFGDERAGRLIC